MRISVEQAIDLIRTGEVVALPTETVYGLAGDATNPNAVARIFEVKRRPADNPLICHFPDVASIYPYVMSIPKQTLRLMETFSPGPISFMLDLPENSPLFFATCGRSQVIVRMPKHEVFLKVLKELGVPLAAPSANTSGRLSPTNAEMVELDLGCVGIAVVDGGSCSVGVESTIVDARTEGTITILRLGAIGRQELQRVLPEVEVHYGATPAVVPGSRYRHYAPATPLYPITEHSLTTLSPGSVLLLVDEQREQIYQNCSAEQAVTLRLVSLGRLSDMEELARSFYRRLFELDRLGVSAAYIIPPDFGHSALGKALQDRLQRILTTHG
ncbi:MAG: L-threonylcarbamoyladenylate synthase [Chitinophagales bacterium]|nr:L-threonylcarbamoyladenylate synthase [Chitinophagales bacterium]MDW8427626.1 L-threonylcarbamoyladenylate synthase [Chitinophagales bacterium]